MPLRWGGRVAEKRAQAGAGAGVAAGVGAGEGAQAGKGSGAGVLLTCFWLSVPAVSLL